LKRNAAIDGGTEKRGTNEFVNFTILASCSSKGRTLFPVITPRYLNALTDTKQGNCENETGS
jgi:hypothetical protein